MAKNTKIMALKYQKLWQISQFLGDNGNYSSAYAMDCVFICL